MTLKVLMIGLAENTATMNGVMNEVVNGMVLAQKVVT